MGKNDNDEGLSKEVYEAAAFNIVTQHFGHYGYSGVVLYQPSAIDNRRWKRIRAFNAVNLRRHRFEDTTPDVSDQAVITILLAGHLANRRRGALPENRFRVAASRETGAEGLSAEQLAEAERLVNKLWKKIQKEAKDLYEFALMDRDDWVRPPNPDDMPPYREDKDDYPGPPVPLTLEERIASGEKFGPADDQVHEAAGAPAPVAAPASPAGGGASGPAAGSHKPHP